VGEKATVASQEAIRSLRDSSGVETRQIAASMRGSEQVWTLAGTDVLTMPLKVAQGYRDASQAPPAAPGPQARAIEVGVDSDSLRSLHFETLWELSPAVHMAAKALGAVDLDRLTGDKLMAVLEEQGLRDFFPRYSQEEIEAIRQDGKIPKLPRWKKRLEAGTTSIDALLNISGLHSFAADQKALDDRVRGLLS
jgi:hypothetical protein